MAKPKRKMRLSQAVTTFGPGAVVDLRFESVIMGGLDFWPSDQPGQGAAGRRGIHLIHEPNLEKALHVSHFRAPTVAAQSDGKDLPITLFPEWMVCPKCRRLAHYDLFSAAPRDRSTGIKCRACNVNIYPARLVIACERGHISDFPWEEWIRHGNNPCDCQTPTLRLYSAGRTASLGDMMVECINEGCGARRSLSGATRAENLRFMSCPGERPWLHDRDNTPCPAPVVPLQRGASNVYFSVPASSISIPPWSRAVYQLTERHWRILKGMVARGSDNELRATIIDLGIPEQLGISVEAVLDALKERAGYENDKNVTKTEKEIRLDEWRALSNPGASQNWQDDFQTRASPVPDILGPYFSKVVLVDRLREVRALLGFTRVNAPDPNPDTRFATPMARISRRQLDWLPAIEMRGEGLYLEFNPETLQTWEQQPEISERAAHLNRGYQLVCERRHWTISRTITPALLLAHSFTHAFIRQLALESGYSASSIRERLYVVSGENNQIAGAGILIYTSTPDSEGSLGGLVRQGYPERLTSTILNTIGEVAWCASDPLCVESMGQGPDTLNLAACHSCLLLPETSCEEFNRLLDRATLVGTLEKPQLGYFNDLVNR